jgi:hypothetical protein
MMGSTLIGFVLIATNPTPEKLGPLERVYLTDQGCHAIGWRILDGPFKGKWRIQQKYGADPYGFLSWLNSQRAASGLRSVRYNPDLEAWSNTNNAAMLALGFGHWVFNPRQCVAAGSQFPGAAWLSSPAHAAVLLDPSISEIGIAACAIQAAFQTYWTLSVR